MRWQEVLSASAIMESSSQRLHRIEKERRWHYEKREDIQQYDNSAWNYSGASNFPAPGKYDNWRSAWSDLCRSALEILEKYENWKMVHARVVAFHAAS